MAAGNRHGLSLGASLGFHLVLLVLAAHRVETTDGPSVVFAPVERVELPPPPEPKPPAPEPEPEPDPPSRTPPPPKRPPRPVRRPRSTTSPVREPRPPSEAPPPRFELPADQVVSGGASGIRVATGDRTDGVPGGRKGGTGAPRRGPPGGTAGPPAGGGDTWAPARPGSIARLPGVVRVPELRCPAVRDLGVFGTVRLRVQVRRDGRVRRVKVLSGIGHGCDRVAARALSRAKFQPAVDRSGRPVDFELTYEYVFELEP